MAISCQRPSWVTRIILHSPYSVLRALNSATAMPPDRRTSAQVSSRMEAMETQENTFSVLAGGSGGGKESGPAI